jgi:hypothetical protein
MAHTDERLLPCPFCGAKPEFKMIGNEHTKKRSVEISCTTSGCFGMQRVGAIYKTHGWCYEEALEKWNKRA